MEELAAATDASGATDRASWLALMDKIGDEAGHFETLGNRHWAFFVDDSPTLLVTFETLAAIRVGSPSQMPFGYAIAKANGWSHLCLIADGDTWYRDPAVYRYFDRMVDDAFFEDFDRVVFYGAAMGAYAACAYSVTAPGATVLAVQPVATLDPAVTEWDKRFRHARRLIFTDRYGYAPDMTEGAGEVFLIHDPEEAIDAMHAALFARPYVQSLLCRNLGAKIEPALNQMTILTPLIEAAGTGKLTPALFYQLYRARRRYSPYLRQIMARLDAAGRPVLAALVARNVASRMRAHRFRRRFSELEAQLAAVGTTLPPMRPRPHGDNQHQEVEVATDSDDD
jgi:hypothetical protein